jgi:hypothetical protein
MSNTATPRSYWQVTLVVFTASLVFGAFFQISKKDPFVTANPFADDPYDAVGSIAIQAAAGIGLLTLARLVHSGVAQGRYILRGNLVVLLSIAVTLVSDALAVVLHPAAWDTWEAALIGGLAILAIWILAGFVLLRRAAGSSLPAADR